MVTSDRQRALGVFSRRQDVEHALHELKASGFPMDKVSLISKEVEQDEQLKKEVQTSDRLGNTNVGAPSGIVGDTLTSATWGTILVGLSSLALPGLGVVIAAGSLGVALVTTVASTGISAAATGGLVKALVESGIPEAQAKTYIDRLIQGDYLIIVESTKDQIQQAETILRERENIQDWSVHSSLQASGSSSPKD